MDIATDTHENIDRTVSGLKDGVHAATAGLQQAQTVLRDGMQKAIKTTEELVSFNQGNLEAAMRSSQILMGGMQDLTQSIAAAANASMEETVEAFKALNGVKSFKDLFELQANMMRSAMERSVGQTSQLTETSMKLAERALAPMSARLAAATDKFGRIG